MVESRFPGAVLLCNPDNLGFAKANNQALLFIREKQLTFDYFIFLNDDVVLVDRSLAFLIEFLQKIQTDAAAGPAVSRTLVSPDRNRRFELTLGSAFLYSLSYPAAAGRLQRPVHPPALLCETKAVPPVGLAFRRLPGRPLGSLAGHRRFPEDYLVSAEESSGCPGSSGGKRPLCSPRRLPAPAGRRANGRWNALWLESLFRYYQKIDLDGERLFGLFSSKAPFFLRFCGCHAAGYQILNAPAVPVPRVRKSGSGYLPGPVSGTRRPGLEKEESTHFLSEIAPEEEFLGRNVDRCL